MDSGDREAVTDYQVHLHRLCYGFYGLGQAVMPFMDGLTSEREIEIDVLINGHDIHYSSPFSDLADCKCFALPLTNLNSQLVLLLLSQLTLR